MKAIRSLSSIAMLAALTLVFALIELRPAHANPGSCMRDFVVNLSRSYACQRIINDLAEHRHRTHDIVVKMPSLNGRSVVFSNRRGELVCGRFEPMAQEPSFNSSSSINARRILAVAVRMADAVNQKDVTLQAWALKAADRFFGNHRGDPPDGQPARTIIAALDAELSAAIGSETDVRLSPDCAVGIGTTKVALPRATGPDLKLIKLDPDVESPSENLLGPSNLL